MTTGTLNIFFIAFMSLMVLIKFLETLEIELFDVKQIFPSSYSVGFLVFF
jgi:hypothetical protein